MALTSNIQEDLEDDVDEKFAKKMKVVDQFQRCRIAELQRAHSRSNFAHKNVTFIKSLSLFGDGWHDLSDGDLYIIGRFCLSVTFLLIYGSRSVFMGIHGSRLVILSSRSVFMVFPGSRLVFHVSRLVFHGFS